MNTLFEPFPRSKEETVPLNSANCLFRLSGLRRCSKQILLGTQSPVFLVHSQTQWTIIMGAAGPRAAGGLGISKVKVPSPGLSWTLSLQLPTPRLLHLLIYCPTLHRIPHRVFLPSRTSAHTAIKRPPVGIRVSLMALSGSTPRTQSLRTLETGWGPEPTYASTPHEGGR